MTVKVPVGQVYQWRVFNHRRYCYQASSSLKSTAGEMAGKLRKQGHRARVTRVGRMYHVYADTD